MELYSGPARRVRKGVKLTGVSWGGASVKNFFYLMDGGG